jgi:GTP-binding protein
MSTALSARFALVPAPVPRIGANRGARRAAAFTVRAGARSRSTKKASPIKTKTGGGSKKSKEKKARLAGGGGTGAPRPDLYVLPSDDGPKSVKVKEVIEADASTSLSDILAMDSPLEVSDVAYEAPPTRFGEMPFGGWDGQNLNLRRADEPVQKETFGAGWADGLAEFREDMREKETARSQARAATREEEESFYVVGAKDARFVDFGADVDDYGDETEGWDSPDDDEEDVFEGRTAMETAAYADIEAKYRAGQAKGAVEFDLGGDDDFEADADGETRSRGIPSEMRCFDTAKIYIKAGDGGRGMVAFRREAFVAQGGPYGGNGGNGGAIFFEADEGINSLVGFRKKVHHRAEAGGNGGGKRMQGSDARDRTVLVPPGTVVRNADTGEVIAEMFAHGHREMIVPGGRGGRGNASFKTAKNKAPQIAENGEEGTELWVEMELKLVADVGIIGVPNAGKSTLLAGVSNAKPKIADYPFTTIVPNLGVVERDYTRMVFADIPGLLEGASEGVGLGFEFLRHVKRTRVLVHVLDCTSDHVVDEYDAIRNEIFLFDPEVGDKPEIVALNKVDASEAAAVKALKLQGEFRARGVDAHVVSALDGSGVAELVTATKDALEALPPIDYEEEARKAEARRGVVARRADGKELSDFEVIDEPYAFYVKGAAIERFVQMTNWDYFESFKRFAQVLKMSGVEKALNEAGAGEGDRIVIGKYEFEWSADNRTGAMYESWKAKQDEKPAGTTQQGGRHWPHGYM